MPCSHCGITGHNIKTCEILNMKRAVEIINNYRDPFIDPNGYTDQMWFHDDNTQITSRDWWLFDPLNRRRMRLSNDFKPILNCFIKIKWLLFENLQTISQNQEIICYGGKIKKSPENSGRIVDFIILSETNHHILKINSERQKRQILALLRDQQIARRNRSTRLRQSDMYRQLQMSRARVVSTDHRISVISQENNIGLQRQDEIRLSKLVLVKNPIETSECPVCMENLGNTNKVVLRCGHQFCGDCIFKHFQKSKNGTNCPMCRNQYTIRLGGYKVITARQHDEMVFEQTIQALQNLYTIPIR